MEKSEEKVLEEKLFNNKKSGWETLSEEEYESLSQDSKKDSFFFFLAIYDWFCNKTGL